MDSQEVKRVGGVMAAVAVIVPGGVEDVATLLGIARTAGGARTAS